MTEVVELERKNPFIHQNGRKENCHSDSWVQNSGSGWELLAPEPCRARASSCSWELDTVLGSCTDLDVGSIRQMAERQNKEGAEDPGDIP